MNMTNILNTMDRKAIALYALAAVCVLLLGVVIWQTSRAGGLSGEKEALTQDLAVQDERVSQLERDNRAILRDIPTLQQLEIEVQDLQDRRLYLAEEVFRLEVDLDRMEGEQKAVEDLRASQDDLEERINALERERSTLEPLIAQLRDNISVLQEELDGLVEMREALTPTVNPVVPMCTGSMEPAITCLDRVEILTNFKPDEIGLGNVIAFTAEDCENIQDGSTLHRVIDISQEAGLFYFETQGDNAFGPDGCKTPESRIAGYVLSIEKNVVPENSDLRTEVNDARDSYDDTKAELETYYNEHCGDATGGETCTPSDKVANEIEKLEAIFEYNACLYENALTKARYQNASTMPSLNVCAPPLFY